MKYVLASVLILLTAATAWAELQPTEVGIIAMAGSPNSRQLAEHYAAARGVPPSQIYLLDATPVDELDRQTWDMRVRPAIRAWLVDNKLDTKIRCLLMSWDVPLKIGKRSDSAPVVVARKEYLARSRQNCLEQIAGLMQRIEALASDRRPERPVLPADVPHRELTKILDGVLSTARQRVQALAPGEKQREAAAAMERIFVAGGGINILLRSMLSQDRAQMSPAALQRLELLRGEVIGMQEGLQALMSLPDSVPRDGQALVCLHKVVGLLGVVEWIDAELDQLQKNETYASFDSELSLIFWHDYPLFRWRPNFLHYSFDGVLAVQGTTMMVSRLAAPTFELARNLVDTAIATEKKGLSGKVYLDARGMDYHPKTDLHGSWGEYDQSLRDLAERLQRRTKLSVVLDNRPELFAPGSCPDAALYCGAYSLGNYVDAFQWRPGSVGYHMASMEAQTLTTPGAKVWCNAMLERGVAATLGPVYEPYLVAFPLPDDFFSLLLTGRYTLVETYYRTNPFNSWVMVLVGDPLYNPFKNNPPLTESDLPERMQSRPRPESAAAAKTAP